EVDQAARCQPRGRRGVARRVGVRVELKEIATGCRVDCADVLGSVHRGQLGIGRQPCGNASAKLHQTLPLEASLDRREAARVLGMIVGSAVKEEALVEDETGGHETENGKRKTENEGKTAGSTNQLFNRIVYRFPFPGASRQARDSASTSSHSPGNP